MDNGFMWLVIIGFMLFAVSVVLPLAVFEYYIREEEREKGCKVS